MAGRDITRALWQMRLDTQKQIRREAMNRPRSGPVADSSAKRDADAVSEITIGSLERCDVTSAVRATNVVRGP